MACKRTTIMPTILGYITRPTEFVSYGFLKDVILILVT